MVNAFRSIQIFLAVYEEGSFTAAAVRENATQPGVSQHVSSLEKSLGVKLFRRKRYDISPTPAGDIFYQYCLDALRALETARKAVRPFANTVDDEITVGLSPTLTQHAFPPAFLRFASRYPNIRISIREFSGPVVRQQVRAGKLDFAVSPAAPRSEGVRSSFFAAIPEVLVSRKGADGDSAGAVAVASLDKAKLVLPPPNFARRPQIEAYLNAHGAVVHQVIEMNSLGSLSLIDQSEWITILPVTAVWAPGRQVESRAHCVRSLIDPPLTIDWTVVEPYQKSRSDAADLFIKFLQQEVESIIQGWGDLTRSSA
jgi:LysR family transcriptional regulator, nitrogen assimilation regulatory protein